MKRCRHCDQRVFPAEATTAFGKVWHKQCFVCSISSCGKMLDSLTACEHQEMLYCEHCYNRNVGNQRNNHGLRPTVTSVTWCEQAAYSYKVYDQRKPDCPPPITNKMAQVENAKKTSVSSPIDVNVTEIRKCPKCDKTVYEAEKVSAAGKVWHKNTCFTCTHCSKRLESRSLCERKGQLFCNVCYGKQFGPKIYGHGSAFINVL